MFIKKLEIKDFRSHQKTVFEFAKINIIRGLNGVGKSSVQMAIEFLLTGRCTLTDERGAGGEGLVKYGAKQATISGQIGLNNGLQQVVTRTRSARGGSATGTAALPVSPDVISACIRAGRYAELTAKEQNELLADVLKPAAVQAPEDIGLAIANAFGFHDGKTEWTLDNLRRLEKEAISKRAECTAALNGLGTPEAPPARDAEMPSAKACAGRLAQLRAELNCLGRERDAILNKWAENARRAREAIAAIPGLQKDVLPAEREAFLLEAVKNELQTNTAVSELAGVRLQVKDTEAKMASITDDTTKCPTCGHETDTEELLALYKDRLSALNSRIPTLEGLVSKYPLAHQAEEILRKHRGAIIAIERFQKTLDESPADETPADTSEIDAKIVDVSDRIERGEGIMSAAQADENARSLYDRLIKQRETLTLTREAADTVAKWAGPNGVQSTMTADKIGDFRDKMNETLHKFGYALQWLGAGLGFIVGRYHLQAWHFSSDQLSESESWRVSAAVQIAIARITGFNFVVLDGADILNLENRSLLMQILFESGLDQVIVLATSENPLPERPFEGTDSKAFNLEIKDGVTEVVPA